MYTDGDSDLESVLSESTTVRSDVDTLILLIEELHIKQQQQDKELKETKEALAKVAKELASNAIHESVQEDTQQKCFFNEGDRVLVKSRHKNRYGQIGTVCEQTKPGSFYLWVLPDENVTSGQKYRVCRNNLQKLTKKQGKSAKQHE